MAESPQERSPGVLSRIGSWLSWGWGSPASSGDDPTSQTQPEEASDEDHGETGQPAGADETDTSPGLGESDPAETSPSLTWNAKHLTLGRGGGDGTGGRPKGHVKRQVKRTGETCRKNRRSRSFERRKAPELFDQMGRRRSGRRRRSSHGDGGGAPAKSPTNPQPESPATTSLTSGPRTAWADSAFEEAADSLPEASGAQAPNSGSCENVVRAEWVEACLSEDTDSPSSPESLFHAALVHSEMDEERVVRLTESAESKRRSIKVSHSEVVFAKKVFVASEEQNEDQNVTFKDATDTKRARSDDRARFPEDRVDGTGVKSKGRIADKISLFERGGARAVSSSTNLHRLGISPARPVASRLKDLTEPAGTRSSSAPPSVKERALNFRRGEEKLTLPSGRTLNEGLPKTAEISSSGCFEKTTAQTDTSGEPTARSKPHLNIDQTDSKSHNATQSTPALSESTSDSNIGNREADSLPTVSSPTDETPQVKSLNRTGSRSKKRKGKDPLSPTKQEMGQGKQEVTDKKDKPLVDVIKTTEQCLKSTSDKERPSSDGEVVSKKPKVPPKLEKAAEIMQSTKKKLDSNKSPQTEMKSKERENSKSFETQIEAAASDTYPPTSRKISSQTEHSSIQEKIERTDIDSRTEEKQKHSNKKQPVQERSEGEQGEVQRNRDMIVNTLFGESGKPDPSVTKEEKPPSLEAVKEANSKDSFETAKSRKDAIQNRASETDTLVVPEKDTTPFVPKVENTPESDPKSAQRPSKSNQKSPGKDCLTEITSQNQKNDHVTETTEARKHNNEVNASKPTEQKAGGITTKTKQGKSKDMSVVKQKDTTIMATSEGEETQTTVKNSFTKENAPSTSRTPATANPALVKGQNDQMDAIISPQIPPTEGGGVKKDAPPPQSQTESREEQKTQIVSSKSDLQQPSVDTKKEVTSIEMTSIVNGDIQSVETEDQFYDCLTESGENTLENTLPEIPSKNESLSLSSVKEKPTSLSCKAAEASTEQVSENFSAKPASTDDASFGLPASSDVKNTALSNSANKKTANEKTPEKPTAIEKTTSPQASTNEETSTLPASANEKTTPLPETTTETVSASLGSRDDKNKPPPASNDEETISPLDSTNEITTPPPVSTNEKNTTSESANKRTTTEKTTLPPASPSVITTHEKPTNIEINTTPQASTNETASTLPASTKGKTTKGKQRKGRDVRPTLPASTPEPTSASLGSRDDENKPPPASTDEETTSPLDSKNEKTTTLQASNNETTPILPASTIEKTTPLPASTTETTSASLGSNDDNNKPPPASTNEKTTTPQASTNETTSTLPASTKGKQRKGRDVRPALPASTTETISASLGSRDDENKPPPASNDEETTSPLDSTNEKTTTLPASTTETVSASLGSRDDKNKPPPASTNEVICSVPVSTNAKTTPPSDSADKKTNEQKDAYLLASTDENIAHSPASTNQTISALLGPASEKTTPSTASANEKAMPLPALTIETTSIESTSTSLGSGDDKTTPPSVLTNKIPPASTDEKTTSSLDSASRKTKNEVTVPPPASTNEKTNETTTTPSASTKEKTTPAKSPAKENAAPPPSSTSPLVSNDITSENERTTPLPVPSSIPITSSNGESIMPLSSSKEKTLSPQDYESGKTTSSPEPINKKPLVSEVSAKAKIAASKSADPSTRKKEFILKPLNLPQIPIAPGSSFQGRDSPSSWLDVDHQRPKKKKLLIPEPNLSSSVSETNLLNVSGEFDPDDFIANVKRLAMPFNLPQRKHNKHRLQAPPFAMPAIKEDHFEKPFDPEEFQYGLRRRREFIFDLVPNAISKSQDTEVKEVDIKPKRESILTRSLIFQRARKESEKEEKEEGSVENTTEPPKAKSRLERCSIVSMLCSPSKGRRMEFLSPTESPSDGPLSPSDGSGSTAPALSQLAPTTEPPKLIPVDETLAKNDSRSAQSGSQVILKPSGDIGLAMTPDLKTTSKDTTITMFTDTNTPFLPSGTQTSSQVVLKPTKDHGPTLVPDLKTTSLDPSVTMLTDKNAALKPTYTQSSSQNVLKPIKDDGPAMTPDLKATSRDPTVTLLTDTNAPLDGSQTSSKVVPKPTKDDEPTQAPDLKATSADPSVTLLTDTNTSSPSSGSEVVLKPIKDDGPAMTPDLKATSMDTTVTLLTDTNAPSPPNGSRTSSKVVPKPTKDDRLSQAPDLKATSADPPVTMLTDTNAPPPASSGSQNVLKPIEIGTTDLKTTSRDPTVALLTDTNTPSPANGSQTFQVVLKPTKDDGPTLTPVLKTTSLDPPVTMLTDSTPPPPSSGSQNVVKPIKDDGPAITPDPKTNSRDPTVTMFTDTKPPPLLSDAQTGSGVVLQPDGPTLKATTVDPVVTKITDANAPPSLPSFDGIKLPSFLEKFLPKEPENTQLPKKIDPLVARESASVPGLVDLNKAVDAAAGKIPEVTIPPAPVVPAAQIPQAKPQRELPNIPAARGIHRRPAKIVIFEHPQFSGQSFEFYRDQPDATHMQLSSVVSIKVVRGCWVLYEKPGFEGRCIALEEERVTDLPNEWAEEGEETSAPVVIGSIRLAVRDYTPPRIELFTEPAGMGRSFEYVDDTEEVGSYSRPQNTGSIKVHSGLWLVYSDPGFQGLLAVLEAGEYPFPQDWGFPVPMVGSLRPLRMGAMKVENPNAVKAVLYEKAGLQGRCVEVQGDVFSFTATETDPSDSDNHGLNCVESLKILGGLWVGYDREGFDGQQFVLEEGEYLDWTDWGGTGEKLLSLRPVFMDFSSPHVKMFSEPDFSERGVSIDLVEPLDNVANTRYGLQTRSVEVLAGVWVAFEGAGFSGQQYVLEKGLYGSPEDWGASHSRICSVVPVVLENLENSCHFQIELFSESGFGGTSVLVQDSLPTMPGGFSVRSCRVHAGSWLAFSGECFSAHQCVLEEGFYSDLRTMGFTQPDVSVLSLQPTGFELSVPSVVLFERSGLRGRRTVLTTSSVNLQMTHSCSRVSSVRVFGGMWVLYEDHNFRGSQFLLKPGAIPDWPKLSSWLRIGSLRPLMQKQIHFRLRNNEAGLLMSVAGSLEDIKLMRIQVSEETGGAEQIWTYQDGLLQCKCLLDVCVDVSSGVLMSGSRAVLSAEPGKPQQLWNITTDGIIRSNAKPDLVLEVKGGQQFDKHQIIVNEFHPDKLNQRWSLEIL